MQSVGLVTANYQIWDGCTPTQNCSQFNHLQWSYTYAIMVYGSAVMFNIVRSTLFAPHSPY